MSHYLQLQEAIALLKRAQCALSLREEIILQRDIEAFLTRFDLPLSKPAVILIETKP